MTLLPVWLTIWDYIGLNGVENLSFCLSLALDRQLEYQILRGFSLVCTCFGLFFHPNKSVCGNQHVAQAILLPFSF